MAEVTKEYVDEMRKLATLSSRLSEFHIKNLRTYVMITIENIESANIDYQVPIMGETNGYVKYKIYTEKGKKAGNKQRSVKQRSEDLIRWTKDLLWNDMDVVVFINDKEVKVGKPRSKNPSSTGDKGTSAS